MDHPPLLGILRFLGIPHFASVPLFGHGVAGATGRSRLRLALGIVFQESVSKALQDNRFVTHQNSPKHLADPSEVGAARAPQDSPSTRSGGQDDVSSQVNSLESWHHHFIYVPSAVGLRRQWKSSSSWAKSLIF